MSFTDRKDQTKESLIIQLSFAYSTVNSPNIRSCANFVSGSTCQGIIYNLEKKKIYYNTFALCLYIELQLYYVLVYYIYTENNLDHPVILLFKRTKYET